MAAFVVRVGYVVLVARSRPLGWDALVYRDLGRQLWSTGTYDLRCPTFDPCTARPTLLFPPLYPAYLGLLGRLGASSIVAQQLVGAGVGAVTVGLVGLLGQQVGAVLGRRHVGVLAAVVAASNPLAIALEGALMAETVSVPVMVAAVLCAVLGARRDDLRWFALAGLLGGLTALSRGEGVPFVALVLLPLALLRPAGRRPRLVAPTLVVVVAALTTTPWLVRNLSVFGRATVAQPSWAGSWFDTADPTFRAGGYPPSPVVRIDGREVRFADLGGTDEIRYYDAVQRHSLAELGANLDAVPEVGARRVLRTFSLVDPWSLFTGPLWMRRLVALFAWALVPLGLAGYVAMRRVLWLVVPFAGTFVLVLTTSVLVYGNVRFRAPADPFLAVGVGMVVAGWLRRTPTSEGSRGDDPAVPPGPPSGSVGR